MLLVGENLCQIRTAIISLIYSHELDRLIKIEDRVEKILDQAKEMLIDTLKDHVNFKDLLGREALEVHLSSEEFLFVEFYLLTIVKQPTNNLQPRNYLSKKIKVIAP